MINTKNKPKVNKYLSGVVQKHGTNFFDSFHEILDKQLNYIANKLKKMSIELKNEVVFKCDQCGRCCDMKQSNIACEIFPTDLKRWLDEDFGVLLVSTGVAVTKEAREAFLFIDRKEDYIKKQKFKLQVYLDDVVKINPSLALVDDKEMQQCMFFNSLTNNCSIYQYRPISCRCYPYGLNPSCEVTTGKEFCGEERFVPGKQENWKEQEGDLKITWANIHGLQLFLKSRISGNIGYQDTKKHKESRVKVEMQKRNEAINMIVGLYQNFITTFCFLYPELVNIEEVSREMQNDKPI